MLVKCSHFFFQKSKLENAFPLELVWDKNMAPKRDESWLDKDVIQQGTNLGLLHLITRQLVMRALIKNIKVS